MTNLFQAAGMEKEAPRPLADRLRPRKLADVVGQDHLVGADGTLTRMLRSGAAAEHDPVGPARYRQDHRGAPAGGRDQPRVRAAFGHLLGRTGPAQGLRPRQEPARDRQGHAAVHRRDPPLQPRAAGQFPAARGGRHDHAGRRHHREPLLRAQRRPAVARPRRWCSIVSTMRRCEDSSQRAEAEERPPTAARRRGARDPEGHGGRRRPHRPQHGRRGVRAAAAGVGATRSRRR